MVDRHIQVEAILTIRKGGIWYGFCKYQGQWMRAKSKKFEKVLEMLLEGCNTIDITRASLTRLSVVK